MLDLKIIKKKLEKRLVELTKRMEGIDDELGDAGDDDFEEMATEAANDETLEEIANVSSDEVEQVKKALTQIEKGTYGKCTACNGAIHPERLKAVPYASRCVKCA